ncbi:hypothetical protein [Nitrosopumilus sp.]|uniref:hypothetical protein n=1 Tax=Nitrosopumilus sp. TaxID=2024843 RepID=UPI00292CB6B4|nr:hypothetical protein [Nitrosopumilus sp.]
MNRIIFYFFILFLLFPLGNAFATYQTEIGDDIFILVQSTVRNSDGTLIAYLESTKFTDLNLSALGSFLDFEASRGSDPIVTIDENKFQVIQRVQSQSFNSEELVASTKLFDNANGKSILLVRFAHDGYSIVPGDNLESIWTFVRPIS